MRVKDLIGKPSPTLAGVAKHYGVDVSSLEPELAAGIEVEKEHTDNPAEAREIALDHLAEFPDYYTRLAKMGAQ